MSSKIHIEEEIYTHEYLWRSATKLLKDAEVDEGSYYYLLPSLLMSFMAFEAFVNFCGFVLLPELWKEEKKNFKGKGIDGKLKTIVSKLPSFSWRKDQSPYRDIKNLESFRDFVAHGKVLASEYVTELREDHSHFRFNHAWDNYVSSVEAVRNSRAAIKSFCDALLIELRKHSDHLHLIHNAFEGPLANGSGASKLS